LASLKAYVLELDDGMADAVTIILITFLFVFGFPIVFLIVYFLKVHKPLEQARIQTPQQVIVKEVVMVPCEYCGGLMPTTATQCPSCRAPRKS
jgi:hypothetical protein